MLESSRECNECSKLFLVFNTSCFGDVLLCNSLCQNIKANYPESKIVFVVDKPFFDVAKYQKDVDEVIIYDKKGLHKGFWGMLRFIKDYGYSKPFASFITYKNERNSLIAKLLKSKYIFSENKKLKNFSTQERHNGLLKNLIPSDKVINYPISYKVSDIEKNNLKTRFNLGYDYVVISPVSKRVEKNMPVQIVAELISLIKTLGYYVVIVGAGKDSENFAGELNSLNKDFLNLVGQTTIPELAIVLEQSKALISVDTGTMHMGCAVNVPMVSVFYESNMIKKWAPNSDLYNSHLISENQTPEKIFKTLKGVLGGQNE